MLKNEFKLIGTVLTDFEEIGSETFSKKKMIVEVDKKNGKGSSQYPVVVYDTNRDIDTSVSYRGKVVILNGYIDIYKSYISLVAQEMFVVGSEELEAPAIEPLPVEDFLRAPTGDRIFDIEDSKPKVELEEDDLPF